MTGNSPLEIIGGNSSLEKRREDEEKRKNWYEKNLQKMIGKGEEWGEFVVGPACSPGENYAAEVERVVVYGRRLCLGVWTDIRRNFIVKKIPEPSSFCHIYCDCDRMFQNEVTAYENIIPMCLTYLEKYKKTPNYKLCFPKFYGRGQNFLVIQDLQPEGYQTVNRLKAFSATDCSLILQELSKFHALSFALQKNEKNIFYKNTEKLEESIFREENIRNFNVDFWEISAKLALKSLKEANDVKFIKGIKILEKNLGQIFNKMVSTIKRDYSRFDVICHGDLWSNNILLRYCECGYPVGVKFIDFQVMRISSCVLDVTQFLCTSSRPFVLKNYFLHLIKEYFDSLVENLKNLDVSPSFTFQDFQEEIKRKIHFGVFVACVLFASSANSSTTNHLENLYKCLGPNYHERLRSLILALTDAALI